MIRDPRSLHALLIGAAIARGICPEMPVGPGMLVDLVFAFMVYLAIQKWVPSPFQRKS